MRSIIFFFNDTATTEIYTLSLHDALPIYGGGSSPRAPRGTRAPARRSGPTSGVRSRGPTRRPRARGRSEEHTSELQSRQYLVCRLLLEKKQTSLHILHYLL